LNNCVLSVSLHPVDNMGGDIAMALSVQHRHTGKMRLRTLAFQGDLNSMRDSLLPKPAKWPR